MEDPVIGSLVRILIALTVRAFSDSNYRRVFFSCLRLYVRICDVCSLVVAFPLAFTRRRSYLFG